MPGAPIRRPASTTSRKNERLTLDGKNMRTSTASPAGKPGLPIEVRGRGVGAAKRGDLVRAWPDSGVTLERWSRPRDTQDCPAAMRPQRRGQRRLDAGRDRGRLGAGRAAIAGRTKSWNDREAQPVAVRVKIGTLVLADSRQARHAQVPPTLRKLMVPKVRAASRPDDVDARPMPILLVVISRSARMSRPSRAGISPGRVVRHDGARR